MKLKALIASALILVTGAASAGDWEFTGFVGADGRAFLQDHRYPEQESGLNMSLIAQPELYWQDVSGDHRFAFVGFGRLDSEDDERTHADIRELFWGYSGDGWDTVIGFNRVFWGVTESQHLVDVINQTDLVEDIDQEDKLGQPSKAADLYKQLLVDFPGSLYVVEARKRFRNIRGDEPNSETPRIIPDKVP